MEKLYHTISETSAMLEESVTTIRYWSNTFSSFLKPARNAKGNRRYTAKDIEVLKKIKYYTRDCGLSLEAVSRKLSGSEQMDQRLMQIKDSLLRIRAHLEQIRNSL